MDNEITVIMKRLLAKRFAKRDMANLRNKFLIVKNYNTAHY